MNQSLLERTYGGLKVPGNCVAELLFDYSLAPWQQHHYGQAKLACGAFNPPDCANLTPNVQNMSISYIASLSE